MRRILAILCGALLCAAIVVHFFSEPAAELFGSAFFAALFVFALVPVRS